MKYSFHPSAKIEFNEAIGYYEDCQEDLDKEFAKEIFSTIQRILQFPDAWSRLSKTQEDV
jgi:predicted KAP-like P-loop ATPase